MSESEKPELGSYLGLETDTEIRLSWDYPPLVLPKWYFPYELYVAKVPHIHKLSLGSPEGSLAYFLGEASRRMASDPDSTWTYYERGVQRSFGCLGEYSDG